MIENWFVCQSSSFEAYCFLYLWYIPVFIYSDTSYHIRKFICYQIYDQDRCIFAFYPSIYPKNLNS